MQVFCVTGQNFATKILPSFLTGNYMSPEDMFHDVLSKIINRGFCKKYIQRHNTTDYKYLSGDKLTLSSSRDIDLYLDLFKRGYSYNDLVERNPDSCVLDSVIIPICNVLAMGYQLDFEKCGIPISKEMEARSIEAVYNEVFQRKSMPFRFFEKTASILPKHPFDHFIYAKLRGIHEVTIMPGLMCKSSGPCMDIDNFMPVFCDCHQCVEYIEDNREWASPVQNNVLSPDERERMIPHDGQAVLQKRKRHDNTTTVPQKRMDIACQAPCHVKQKEQGNIVITPAQRQRMEANRLAALAIQRERMEAKDRLAALEANRLAAMTKRLERMKTNRLLAMGREANRLMAFEIAKIQRENERMAANRARSK